MVGTQRGVDRNVAIESSSTPTGQSRANTSNAGNNVRPTKNTGGIEPGVPVIDVSQDASRSTIKKVAILAIVVLLIAVPVLFVIFQGANLVGEGIEGTLDKEAGLADHDGLKVTSEDNAGTTQEEIDGIRAKEVGKVSQEDIDKIAEEEVAKITKEELEATTQEEINKITQEQIQKRVGETITETTTKRTQDITQDMKTGPTIRPAVHTNKFACENANTATSRGYILLMGLKETDKSIYATEKTLMESDPKAKFIQIYPTDETQHLAPLSDKFLADVKVWVAENPVKELVIFGFDGGGVISSNSISKLDFSGTIAHHTLAAPINGYDLTGFRAQFLGDKKGLFKDIMVGFEPFDKPGSNVKTYHHKTVTDSILLNDYCAGLEEFCDVLKIQNNNIGGSKDFYYPEYDHDEIVGKIVEKVLTCYN